VLTRKGQGRADQLPAPGSATTARILHTFSGANIPIASDKFRSVLFSRTNVNAVFLILLGKLVPQVRIPVMMGVHSTRWRARIPRHGGQTEI
jgi:hypothetical protein